MIDLIAGRYTVRAGFGAAFDADNAGGNMLGLGISLTRANLSVSVRALDFTTGALPAGVTFTRAGGGGRINSSGLYEWVGADVPRFDYDPVTLACKGLLIEESRTNTYTYNRDFTNAAWIKEATTITPAARLSRDGTMGMSKLVAPATTAIHRLTRTTSLTAGLNYSISVDAAAGEYGYLRMECVRGGAGTAYVVHFDLSTGAVVFNEGDRCPASRIYVGNLGNGIRRYTLVVDALTTAVHPAYVYGIPTAFNPISWAGDGTSGIYIDFAEHVVGAFPASTIPTVASPATRAADTCVMAGADFSRWFNPIEGTVVVEFLAGALHSSRNYGLWNISPSGMYGGDVMAGFSGSGTAGVMSVNSGGVGQAYITGGNFRPYAVNRMAAAYKANDFARSINGGAVLSDTSGTIPAGLARLDIGKLGATFEPLDGHIRRVLYYPSRLENSRIQQLAVVS